MITKKDYENLKESTKNLNFDNNFNLIENYNYFISERILIKIFQKIFRYNQIIISISQIRIIFKNVLRFLIINVCENIIKNKNDLKYYFISENNLNFNNCTEHNNKNMFNLFSNYEFDNNFNLIKLD